MAMKDTYYRLDEYNGWEGETWYHYFIKGPGAKEALESMLDRIEGHDFGELKTVKLSDEEATVLVNLDDGGYMQTHWFGKLNVKVLNELVDGSDLYKGGIRDFAEDLFESVVKEKE